MTRSAHAALGVLGALLVGYGVRIIEGAPTDSARHVGAGFVMAGLCLLPSVPALLAAGVKAVGTALAQAWAAKNTPPAP